MIVSQQRLIVIGANSGIAHQVAFQWERSFAELVLVVRNSAEFETKQWQKLSTKPALVVESGLSSRKDEEALKEVFISSQQPTLVINFAGYFGEPSNWEDTDLEEILRVVSNNLSSFLVAAKSAKYLPEFSLLVGFSGAGIGGPNVDLASLGYTLSKSALAGVVEALDKELTDNNVHLCLVAPGAFPTKMQQAVAEAPTTQVNSKSKIQAQNTMSTTPDASRLISLFDFLLDSPSRAGGRIWSAGRDELESLASPDGEFGKIRRA